MIFISIMKCHRQTITHDRSDPPSSEMVFTAVIFHRRKNLRILSANT